MSESSINKYDHRRKIHLYHQPRTTKSRGRVNYYSLATCYFEAGKNKKKVLQTIGELTPIEVEQYKFLLQAMNGQIDASQVVDIETLIFKSDRQYLDVLAMDAIWRELKLNSIFDNSLSNNQRISTEHVARILTINRLLSPAAKSRTTEWLGSTLLAPIMGIDANGYERNKIFRELKEIHKAKQHIEELFMKFSQKEKSKYDVYYFDGSTSWFEGTKCPLAEFDLEKTRGFFPQVVGLMLLTDNLGYPVAWEVVNGHTKDNQAIKKFVDRISKTYNIREITYCFDRGVASQTNFDLLSVAGSKYISAIRDNQISDVFDLERFKIVRMKISDIVYGHSDKEKPQCDDRRRIIGVDGFHTSDNNIFFKELGIIGDKRYVASFNHELFIKETNTRIEAIQNILAEIEATNLELEGAKKDRDFNATERALLERFTHYHVRPFFEYRLLPLVTKSQRQSFKIEVTIKKSKMEDAALSDGLLVYISNHTEQDKNRKAFLVSSSDIVEHYKGKYVVENAFRELKSFIEIRPFYVWTEEHVKAHYDIAIMACFIDNYIYRKLQPIGGSLRKFHEHIAVSGRVAELASPTGLNIFKLRQVSEETKKYFESLGINEMLSTTLHRHHNVFR